jgi:hypothetical protein
MSKINGEKRVLLEENNNQEINQDTINVSYKNNVILNSLPKYSNGDLLKLKAKKDEENRINKITEYVERIYHRVIEYAENNSSTKYECLLPTLGNPEMNYCLYNNQPIDNFYITNKIEIISNLQNLFPECDIKYVTLNKWVDPNNCSIFDIDNLPKHLENLKNNKQSLDQNTKKIDYLIIDWS